MIVDEYGTYIHKKSNRFIFDDKTEKLLKKGFSADKVSQIHIYTGAAVTADAIELAVKKGIDIVYLDRIGRPFARKYSCEQQNSAAVQRCQAKAYDDGKGTFLMSSMKDAIKRGEPAGGKCGVKIWSLTDEGKIYAVYFSKEKL